MFFILLAVLLTLIAFGVGWALETIIPIKAAKASGLTLTIYKTVGGLLAVVIWFEDLVERVTFRIAGVPPPPSAPRA